jgi:hypothetical protein
MFCNHTPLKVRWLSISGKSFCFFLVLHSLQISVVVPVVPDWVILMAGQVIASASETVIRPHHRRATIGAEVRYELHSRLRRLEHALARNSASVHGAYETAVELAHGRLSVASVGAPNAKVE